MVDGIQVSGVEAAPQPQSKDDRESGKKKKKKTTAKDFFLKIKSILAVKRLQRKWRRRRGAQSRKKSEASSDKARDGEGKTGGDGHKPASASSAAVAEGTGAATRAATGSGKSNASSVKRGDVKIVSNASEEVGETSQVALMEVSEADRSDADGSEADRPCTENEDEDVADVIEDEDVADVIEDEGVADVIEEEDVADVIKEELKESGVGMVAIQVQAADMEEGEASPKANMGSSPAAEEDEDEAEEVKEEKGEESEGGVEGETEAEAEAEAETAPQMSAKEEVEEEEKSKEEGGKAEGSEEEGGEKENDDAVGADGEDAEKKVPRGEISMPHLKTVKEATKWLSTLDAQNKELNANSKVRRATDEDLIKIKQSVKDRAASIEGGGKLSVSTSSDGGMKKSGGRRGSMTRSFSKLLGGRYNFYKQKRSSQTLGGDSNRGSISEH